jgi:hypothetical protein
VVLGQQLKVLRALQVSLNAQTGRLDDEGRAGGLDAEALRGQASKLAARQGDLLDVARSLEDAAGEAEVER